MNIEKQFFRNVSEINFAFFNHKGNLTSASYNISLEIESLHKQDVNTLNKFIEGIFSDNFVMFDGIQDKKCIELNYVNNMYQYYTDNCVINIPDTNVLYLNYDISVMSTITETIKTNIQNQFNDIFSVNCYLDNNIAYNTAENMCNLFIGKFRANYNIIDGSMNWIEAETDNFYYSSCEDCKVAEKVLFDLCNELNEKIFVNYNNLSDSDDISLLDDSITIMSNFNENITCTFNKSIYNRIIFNDCKFNDYMGYIKEYCKKYRDVLIRGHIKKVFVSTGLNSGEYITLSY